MPLSAQQVKDTVRYALENQLKKWERVELQEGLGDDEVMPMLVFSEYADPDTTDVGYVSGILWITPDKVHAENASKSAQQMLDEARVGRQFDSRA